MKHSIDYYIEHIEPMIDNLNRQQEIQIDNTKFLVLKVRTKGVTYILIASQYNWNGVHYWVYNTNTKQVENIIHSTYHFMFRFKHSMNIEYEIIGNTIPFDKSAEMYNRSTYIGPADDGWSKIVKVDDQYYMVQQGLQEYEGHVYMCQVKITAIEILN